VVTLRATDSQGASGTAIVSLTITSNTPNPTLGLQPVASGLSNPVFLTTAPGDPTRLFVVEKTGKIRIIKNGSLQGAPFLDITDSVSTGGEQGLLGVAFDPSYASTGRFYVSYTSPHGSQTGGTSVLARYHVSANADVADVTSGQTILTVDQPYDNHNGGMIGFGPDGFLYFGLGDGGSGGDPQGHGQDRSELLGSVLRLDVSGNGTYTIPPSNPYFGSTSRRPELWNYGLRNPWRFSFDRATGDLYIGDVGQNAREEIDVQPAASPGGENYGWNIMEGLSCYGVATCNQTGLTLPVLDYDHGAGCAVTGGYVYRGGAIPSLAGHYLYGDYCSGTVWSFRYLNGQAVDRRERPDLFPNGNISSFGQDGAGELYIVTLGGTIYRIVAR
jgi:glucose/arabinose dehydrogenase